MCSVFFAAYHIARRPPRADTHAAVLGLFSAVLVNAVATNGIKIMVRLRQMCRAQMEGAEEKHAVNLTDCSQHDASRPR